MAWKGKLIISHTLSLFIIFDLSFLAIFFSAFPFFPLFIHFSSFLLRVSFSLAFVLFPPFLPPVGSNRLAQSDAMVVIGCPPPLIRSQLALGGLWRLPIIPTPTDQGLNPQRAADRQEGKGLELILFIFSVCSPPPVVSSPPI